MYPTRKSRTGRRMKRPGSQPHGVPDMGTGFWVLQPFEGSFVRGLRIGFGVRVGESGFEGFVG